MASDISVGAGHARDPSSPQPEQLFTQALALHQAGQFAHAALLYKQVLQLRPHHFDALHLRGVIAAQLHNPAMAVQLIQQALAFNPTRTKDHAHAYNNLGNALLDLNDYEAAIDSYQQALALDPAYEFLHGIYLYTKLRICDWRDLAQQVAQLEARVAQGGKVSQPFPVLAVSDSLVVQKKAAQIWVQSQQPAAVEPLAHSPRRSKIRVGYFSADFHNHATMYLLAELFERHDKNKFELIAFSFGPPKTDDMRKRAVAAFDQFIDVRTRSDADIAKLARQLGIDIAVDLKGFTQDGRAGVFAARAAPIQVSYLGYPGTMGAPYMDYLIADKVLIPQVSQEHYSEKIVYLPGSYQINDASRPIAQQVLTRQELGLPPDGFVFCCFNNNYKIMPHVFDVWMRLLQQVQGSVLWLLADNPLAMRHLQQEAAQRGVDPQRLVFAQRMPLPEHLARHQAADLFLDTLPYNAGTTTSDALWAGLPVLTCTGPTLVGRLAASMLTAIDLPELITTDLRAYEALALELARDGAKLQALKQKLASHRLSTPLFDTKRSIHNMELAFMKMYERYQAHLPPGSMSV